MHTFSVFLCFVIVLGKPGKALVVDSFEHDCKDFFYKGTPPEGIKRPRNIRICQCTSDDNNAGNNNNPTEKFYFATLFDPVLKIPLYSAYIRKPGPHKGNRVPWMYEPQVENRSSSEMCMKVVNRNRPPTKQANDDDYRENVFTRGHINPNGHHSGEARKATFTYTNVAPQYLNFNNGPWSANENQLGDFLDQNCGEGHTAYVLVGTIPSSNAKTRTMNNRVNIPYAFWSAYCCYNNNSRNDLFSFAALGYNVQGDAKVKKMNVSQLQCELFNYYNKTIKLFHSGCGKDKRY